MTQKGTSNKIRRVLWAAKCVNILIRSDFGRKLSRGEGCHVKLDAVGLKLGGIKI